MKKLLLLLLCVPLIGFGQTEKKEIDNDLTRTNVKGRVKEIMAMQDGGGRALTFVKIKFNEHGNKTVAIFYNADGELDRKSKYQYDEYGNKTEYSYYSDGKISYKTQYYYDEYGSEIEKISYNADGIRVGKIKKYNYEYDKLGNWIVLTEYSVDKLTLFVEREIEYYQ